MNQPTVQAAGFLGLPSHRISALKQSNRTLGSIFTSTSSTSGMMATVAVEVCTRPLVSVAGTRCTRCTPDSYFSLLYTLRE